MKELVWPAIAVLAASLSAHAQSTANPVVSSAKEIFSSKSALIVAAAEEMPADKFSFHPTPDQWSFGRVVAHVVQGSYAVCGMLSDSPAKEVPKVSETDSKDTLVTALKGSFAFCDQALANLQDSKLGDTITFFRGAQKPRARALLELTIDVTDHYSQMASYLRLSGLTPPSAKPRN